MSNFKFLLSDPGMVAFAEVAMAAEKILHIDPAANRVSTSLKPFKIPDAGILWIEKKV